MPSPRLAPRPTDRRRCRSVASRRGLRPATVAAVALVLGLLSLLVVPELGGTGHADDAESCLRKTVRVTLTPSDPTQYTIVGWLCARGQVRGKTVQVLLSGLTYDHHYWDMPYRDDEYSYVHAAMDHDFAVLSVDRIGVGESDRPPADLVTVPAEGHVTHQVVQAVRRGDITGSPVTHVVGVGHSLGSAIWIVEAAQHTDVDALVLSSYLHQPVVAQQTAIAATLQPASREPNTGGTVPAGYFTTTPGSRLADFYAAPYADPDVVRTDEHTKQTATSGERATLNVAREPSYTAAIRIPVMILVGQYDTLACSPQERLSCADATAICLREAPYFHSTPNLTAYVVPASGHSIALHRDADQWFQAANHWLGNPLATTGANHNDLTRTCSNP
jgi:pimeloyl-ACP methyl ester carboxylesterase